jgi:hypothetical protein
MPNQEEVREAIEEVRAILRPLRTYIVVWIVGTSMLSLVVAYTTHEPESRIAAGIAVGLALLAIFTRLWLADGSEHAE